MLYRRVLGLPQWQWKGQYEDLERMRRRMDSLFQELSAGSEQVRTAGVYPLVNITEDAENFYIRAELPGIKAQDLDIQATGKSVSISGERKIAVENARYHRRERESGKFSRVMDLPGDIDADKVDACLSDGVLTVFVPKAESVKPRQIAVK